jgi:two-component system CheB/CheR fusion protein
VDQVNNTAIFPIAGVGASAGGIEALEGFFRGMPAEPGVGIVVVTHLNPERKSFLHEIIGRHTNMPVQIATDGARVQPNCVYVLPPDAIVGIRGGVLETHSQDPHKHERRPIDIFLSMLAKDLGERAIAVVLSGGDSDGALGTKAVKERGGLTLAQVSNGSGPAHPSMPDSAISTGFVDFAVPAHEMGAKITQFASSFDMLETMAAAARSTDSGTTINEARKEICRILRDKVGHDFAGYKTSTFLRRVQRRIQVRSVDSIEAYVDVLRQDPQEIQTLFRDLLIQVTNFFRDAGSFDKLAEIVIPKLFKDRTVDDTVRVWVPGCATGEEVYSIAILMREHMDKLIAAPRVQIFATDIDEHALSVARAARYPETLLDTVSPERRHRFFVPDASSYVLTKAVRELCIFSPHSLIRDPPFSRIDLVSCRNLLIYFGADARDHVIPTFHYSLRTGGFLFLGSSESVGQFSGLFTPVDKKHCIFRSRADATAPVRMPPILTSQRPQINPIELAVQRAAVGGMTVRQISEKQVLDRFSPAYVVTNRDGEVICFSARTGKYIEPAIGVPTRQILSMARKGMHLDLRTALSEAVEGNRRIVRRHVAVEGDDGRVQLTTLTIEPIAERTIDEPLYLVLFSDEESNASREAVIDRTHSNVPIDVARLESELHDTRERFQLLIEDYEAALEELKSANEELVSVNEEMQSTNEEMEASKEELQSVNEELQSVNSELHTKIEELNRANSDLSNLFVSNNIATVFLDENFLIRNFTPTASKVFSILPTDRGRPLSDLRSRLPLPDLHADILSVFATGTPIERHVLSKDGGSNYLEQLLPYRNSENVTRGVVLSFVDVTAITRSEANQELQKVLIAELNHRVKNTLAVVLTLAEQTSDTSASMEDFKTAYLPRLHALARTHRLLSRDNWTETSLESIARQEIELFGKHRVEISGPPIHLHSAQALSMGMILHELATNASKYGAFSVPNGRVVLSWNLDVEDKTQIFLSWRESGGPAVSAPARRGFGLNLVEGEVGYSMLGNSVIAFEPDGVKVDLNFKLQENDS